MLDWGRLVYLKDLFKELNTVNSALLEVRAAPCGFGDTVSPQLPFMLTLALTSVLWSGARAARSYTWTLQSLWCQRRGRALPQCVSPPRAGLFLPVLCARGGSCCALPLPAAALPTVCHSSTF